MASGWNFIAASTGVRDFDSNTRLRWRLRYLESPNVFLDEEIIAASGSHSRSWVGIEPCRTYVIEIDVLQGGVSVDDAELSRKLRQANASDLARANAVLDALAETLEDSISIVFSLSEILRLLQLAKREADGAVGAINPGTSFRRLRNAGGFLERAQTEQMNLDTLQDELRASSATLSGALSNSAAIPSTTSAAVLGTTGIVFIIATGLLPAALWIGIGYGGTFLITSLAGLQTFAIGGAFGAITTIPIAALLGPLALLTLGLGISVLKERARDLSRALERVTDTETGALLPNPIGLIPDVENALDEYNMSAASVASLIEAEGLFEAGRDEIIAQIARTDC